MATFITLKSIRCMILFVNVLILICPTSKQLAATFACFLLGGVFSIKTEAVGSS